MLVSISVDIHWPQARTLSGANLMVLSKRETVLNVLSTNAFTEAWLRGRSISIL